MVDCSFCHKSTGIGVCEECLRITSPYESCRFCCGKKVKPICTSCSVENEPKLYERFLRSLSDEQRKFFFEWYQVKKVKNTTPTGV